MCYNCGCGVTDDNMGKDDMTGAALTDKSFEEMAKAWGMTVKQAQKEVKKALDKKLQNS